MSRRWFDDVAHDNAPWAFVIPLNYWNIQITAIYWITVTLRCTNHEDQFRRELLFPAVHVSRLVQQYPKKANVQTLMWLSKSPDLNIFEDVWKIISGMVYDGPQLNSVNELERKISDVIHTINNEKRQLIIDLYGSIRRWLCKVLASNGNLYNC